jgi:RNA polymerase sigma-70 factor (ECF subfamily)
MPNAATISPAQNDVNRAPPITTVDTSSPDVFVAALRARNFAGTSPADVCAPSPNVRTTTQLTRKRLADDTTTNGEPTLNDEVIGSDQELAARFERDVVPLIPQLFGGARRMTRTRADAEDLIQETMLKAYARFRTFCPGTYLKAWLFRIMYNTWVNGYHYTQRRPQEFLSGDISDTQLAAHARQASSGSIGLRSAEVEALDGLRDSQIAEAMETLREDLRKVVHYACVDGLRYKEIAQIMDIPVGTVMSRLYRARKQLQAELADLAQERGFGRDPRTKVAV